jgi:hypothetical protein
MDLGENGPDSEHSFAEPYQVVPRKVRTATAIHEDISHLFVGKG